MSKREEATEGLFFNWESGEEILLFVYFFATTVSLTFTL